jgi:hypothetical protein
LQRQVATLVEEAEQVGADSIETFFRIKALALAADGQGMCVASAIEGYGSRKVLPHLTESWFC